MVTLDSFSPIGLLGMGGMGEVWKYLDTQLNRYVAIKFMQPHIMQSRDAVQRFYREARTVALLNHPNIVHIYAASEKNGVLYFIMELVEGDTLSRIIERSGALPLGIAVKVLRQTVEGMEYALSCGVIHRDIKPANLMVTADTTVKITDFGLAKLRTSESNVTQAGNALGSPNYMSPEQAQGKPADHRSDIYSLGITFYQMLAGHVPFHAETPLAILLKQVSEPLPELPFLTQICDGQVLKIIRKMTEKNPDDRYQNYAELKQDITALGSQAGDLPAFANSIGNLGSLPATPAVPLDGGALAARNAWAGPPYQGTAGDAELELPPSIGHYASSLTPTPARPGSSSGMANVPPPSAPRAMYLLVASVSGLLVALLLVGGGGYLLLQRAQLLNAKPAQDPAPVVRVESVANNKFTPSQTVVQKSVVPTQPADASLSENTAAVVTPAVVTPAVITPAVITPAVLAGRGTPPNTTTASGETSTAPVTQEIAATTSTAPTNLIAAAPVASIAQSTVATTSTAPADVIAAGSTPTTSMTLEIAATTSTAPTNLIAAESAPTASIAQSTVATTSTAPTDVIAAGSAPTTSMTLAIAATTSTVPTNLIAAAPAPATPPPAVIAAATLPQAAPPAPPTPTPVAEPVPSDYGVFAMEGKKAVPLEKDPICQLSVSTDPEFIAFDKLVASSNANWEIRGMERDLEVGIWVKQDLPTTTCRTQPVSGQSEMVRLHSPEPLAPGFYCLKGPSKETYFGVELDQLKRDVTLRANAILKEKVVSNEGLQTVKTAAAFDAGNTRWRDAWQALSTPRLIPSAPGALSELRFTPDGKQLIGFKDTVFSWQMPEGATQTSIEPGKDGTFSGISIAGDGSSRIVGTLGSKMCLWDGATGAKVCDLEGSKEVRNVVFAGDTVVGDLIKPASKKQEKSLEVRSWSLDGKLIGGHAIPKWTEGNRLQAAGHSSVLAYTNRQVGHVFDVAVGKFLADIPSALDVIAISSKGEFLVLRDADNALELWDPDTSAARITCKGIGKAPDVVAISPDGKRIVAGCTDKETGIWDAASGDLVCSYPGSGPILFSADGSLFARVLPDQVVIHNTQTGAITRSLTCPGQSCFAFDPNLQWAASASGLEVRLWRLRGFPNPGDLEGVLALNSAQATIPRDFEKKLAEAPAPKQRQSHASSGRTRTQTQTQARGTAQQQPGMSAGQFVTGLGQTGILGRNSGRVESVGKTMELFNQLGASQQ